jgi:STE24 endopeptidase
MNFDPEVATQAWMATLGAAARARSDAYFEGGYWILLWEALVSGLTAWLVLRLGWAARLSARVQAFTPRKWLQSFLFALPYMVIVALITAPFAIYTEYYREQQYSLMNQGFGEWLGENTLIVLINGFIVALLFIGIHAAIRRAPTGWWTLATGISVTGLAIVIMIGPVFFEPLFNKYAPLPAGPVRDAVLSMARANGVPADNVYLVDASKQSDRISANVAGLFGTTRIALNDNLLKQPVNEVRAVMAHELGHYVLNHIWKMLITLSLIIALAFLAAARLLPWLLARFGSGWGVTSLADPAILPVAFIIFAGLGVVLTPFTNTLIRTQEMEADRFGLNAARAPEGFASIAMKLSQYRKIEPGPWEEIIFFDHPSGYTRVSTAMRWKAEHVGQSDVR